MEKETPNFCVKELNGIRNIVQSLIEEDFSETEELFLLRMNELVAGFKRSLQDRQLHLNKGAVIFMDHLQVDICQISENCSKQLILLQNSLSPHKFANLEIIITAITEIFEYLTNDYAHCFNFQMRVPQWLKTKLNISIAKEGNKLAAKLKNAGLEEELLAVLSEYQQELLLNERPSFHELGFWNNITKAIDKIDLKNNPDLEFSLFSECCYLNFNYAPVIQFCAKKIQRNYDLVDDYREEYIKTTVQLRTLRQFYVKQAYGFDKAAAPLSQVLDGILTNELLCIKKLLNMNKKSWLRNGAKLFLRQFYFRISIPIELFLFIFRLMIEKGIILVKRKADLYEFIHSHVGTVNRDNLSIGNMQNTYAENNRKTAIRVKVLLQSLIAQIDEKYLSMFCVLSIF